MSDIFSTYGPDVVAWVMAALGTLLGTYVFKLMSAGWAREMLQRAWIEVQGAVLEVSQTYADEIRRGRADGALTDEEKVEARTRALEIARANLGTKGLARLSRVLGFDADGWIASKTEQAVRLHKQTQPLPLAESAPPGPPVPA